MNSYVSKFFESCKNDDEEELVSIGDIKDNISKDLAKGFLEILISARVLDVPMEIEIDAHKMFYKLSEIGFFHDRDINIVANSCLFIAGEENNYPIVPRDLADQYNTSSDKIYSISEEIRDDTGVISDEEG